MAQKPSIPKGTRDFAPIEVSQRKYIFTIIEKVFHNYGFLPIQTPSFELTSTLLGKYGEEGDRLIFRILNSGEKLKKADFDALNNNNLARFANSLSEKALRYDLTVPFARYVVQHQNSITFPFRRYQIQPVWRADRPQHGRYQEFMQCDADVIGSTSLTLEVDLILMIDDVLTQLGLTDFTIKLNNRKILAGIAQVCGETNKIIDITVAIDKLDKIGQHGVVEELRKKNISESAIEKIKILFNWENTWQETLPKIKTFLSTSEVGLKGVEELEYVLTNIEQLSLKRAKIEFNLTLARGLNYYTGAIIEVKSNEIKMGSICGGGRYDDLTGLFGIKNMSGIGISFGADRIYDIMNSLQLFPNELYSSVSIILVHFDEQSQRFCMKIAQKLRKNNISCIVYPEQSKIQKQLKYANDIKTQYAGIVGEQELNTETITLKNLKSGEQETISIQQLLQKFNSQK